jgi:hypothetical protein
MISLRGIFPFPQDLLLGCFLYAVYGILDFWIIPKSASRLVNPFRPRLPLCWGLFFTFSRLSRRLLEPALILACFAAGAESSP